MQRQKGYPNLIVQQEKFTPERARHAAEVLRATGSLRQTAEIVGVSRKTLKKWPRKSPEFKAVFDRWERLQWERQLMRGDLARLNLIAADQEAETRGNGSQNALTEGAGCPDPPWQENPLRNAGTAPEERFWSEQEMRRQWEEEQERLREAERQREIPPGCDVGF